MTTSARTPRPSTAERARAAAVVGILGGAGATHFLNPKFFDPIVPDWMPAAPRTVTYVSGVFEMASAALVARGRTRRLGGLLAFVTFIGIFPANVQAALDGGMKDLDPPFNSPAVAWARLPLQFPMIWLAWRVAKDAKRLA